MSGIVGPMENAIGLPLISPIGEIVTGPIDYVERNLFCHPKDPIQTTTWQLCIHYPYTIEKIPYDPQ